MLVEKTYSFAEIQKMLQEVEDSFILVREEFLKSNPKLEIINTIRASKDNRFRLGEFIGQIATMLAAEQKIISEIQKSYITKEELN